MGSPGDSWKLMEIHGNPMGDSWKTHGKRLRGFQELMENSWELMENSWEIHGNSWNSWKFMETDAGEGYGNR